MKPKLKYLKPDSSQSFPRSGAPFKLYALAGSTHDDISIYGAASLAGHPLRRDFLFGLTIIWCAIAGIVKMHIIERIKI